MDRWNRRQFVQGVGVAGLGLVVGCGRLPGQAQALPRMHRIGTLHYGGVENAGGGLAIFREALGHLGYIEGRNLAIEQRWPTRQDRSDLDALAADLVAARVDLIVAFTTAAAQAARQATSSIPIVFTVVSDPVGSGLVASLARPGGNATGLSDFGATLSGKRLELLRDAVPGAARIGVLGLLRTAAQALQWRELDAAAPSLGVQLVPLELHTEDAVESAFEAAIQERVQALIVLGGPATAVPAAVLATAFRVPTLLEQTSLARADGLMAYGPNQADLYRRAAYYVDRILKGAKPSDLPVEQPRELDFIINLKTAQALGLTIPPHVLLQATEVIH